MPYVGAPWAASAPWAPRPGASPPSMMCMRTLLICASHARLRPRGAVISYGKRVSVSIRGV
jgi:hypothetical protein